MAATDPKKNETEEQIRKQNEIEESRRDSKRTNWCQKIEILILLGIGIAYIIYGAFKIQAAKETPDSKISEKEAKMYTLPGVVGCLIEKDEKDYFDIQNIYIDGVEACGTFYADCNQTDPDLSCPDQPKVNCTSLMNSTYHTDGYDVQIGNGTYYDIDGNSLYCLIVLPNTKKNFTKKFNVQFVYLQSDMTSVDTVFLEYYNFSLPQFLVNQNDFSIYHWTFHMDELLDYSSDGKTLTISEVFNSNFTDEDGTVYTYNPIDSVGSDTYVGPAFSNNEVELELYTNKDVSGKESNTYQSSDGGSKLDDSKYQTDGVDIYSIISNTYHTTQVGTQKTRGTFYQHYTTEFYAYTATDLLSGLGGIVSGAQGLIEIFLGIFLLGFAVDWLRVRYRGFAPLPELDETDEIKIKRLLYKWGVEMKNE